MPNPADKPKGNKNPPTPGGRIISGHNEEPIRYEGVCPDFDVSVGAAAQNVFARDFVPFQRENVVQTPGFPLTRKRSGV